ncbi:MAG TPA: hypothetical protein VF646_20715 [Cytophagales bacterium]
MRSVFLQSQAPYPAMHPGDTLNAKAVHGLSAFSPLLEIVHSQAHVSTLIRGETHHQCLVFARACHPPGQAVEIPVQDLTRLTNRHMLGSL